MIRVYSPELVTINFAGMVLSGFSEDSMITIEKDEENHLPYNGVLGEHSVAKNANQNYTTTIQLASDSPFISILRDIANSDDFVHPFSIINMNDDAQDVSTDSAYIIKTPDYKANKEVEDVEVQIRLVRPTFS